MKLVLKLTHWAALALALFCGGMAALIYTRVSSGAETAPVFGHLMAMLGGSALLVAFGARFALRKLDEDHS